MKSLPKIFEDNRDFLFTIELGFVNMLKAGIIVCSTRGKKVRSEKDNWVESVHTYSCVLATDLNGNKRHRESELHLCLLFFMYVH